MSAIGSVIVREYTNARDYRRDVEHLPRHGWQIVSTLERKPRPDLLHYLTFGLSTLARGPERLVTYARAAGAGGMDMTMAPATVPATPATLAPPPTMPAAPVLNPAAVPAVSTARY